MMLTYYKNVLSYGSCIFREAGFLKEKIMFRMWGKLFLDNHMTADYVAEDDSDDTRTHKVFRALEEICGVFDLMQPIWLDKNIKEFQRLSKTRFHKDSFVEMIPFDYLEIQIIEE